MKSETRMYTLKPIITLPGALEHSKTMYRMRNIHEDKRHVDHTVTEIKIVDSVKEQVINFLKTPLPEYAMLEARQEKILAQLAELKKQVSTLCDFLKQTKQTEPAKDLAINKEAINVDIVIHVNPKRPPYSILALQNIWTHTKICLQPYIHSTITEVVPVLNSSHLDSSRHNTINLSMIWKDVDNFEFTSGLRNYSLIGEVNFLRYVSRLVDIHNYEESTIVKPEKIDAILDLCHCLYSQESPKDTQEILSLIANKIEKETLPNKRTPNIADIAIWSLIKQISPKKLPSNLTKWFDTCNKLFT